SVPYALVGAGVEIRATATAVEILHRNTRVASHPRSYGPKGSAVTADEHRPRAHREYGKWPPERITAWAATVGPPVAEFARVLFARRTHPETGYRSCLGVIRMAERYGPARVDAACARAIQIRSTTAKTVHAILQNGLDRAPLVEDSARPHLDHE